jgi:Domain of unknown function (DUF4157)
LPEAVRSKMETALRADFSDVRVYVGPQAERIGAIAFTIGSDVYFAPGRYQPDTIHGQQLLGHELAHVVQQRAGRVRNPLGTGLVVVQDQALEAEADRLGRHAAAHRTTAQAKMGAGVAPPAMLVRIPPSLGAGPGRHRVTAAASGLAGIVENGSTPAARRSVPIQRLSLQRRGAIQAAWANIVKTAPKPTTTPVTKQPVPQAQPQYTYEWVITKSARNHYNDGWGAAYGITSDQQLKAFMTADLSGAASSIEDPLEILIGPFRKLNKSGNKTGEEKGCNILYFNEWTGNHCKTVVFHCGPTVGAG